MDLWSKVVKQFGKPSGFLGRIAGFIMSKRGSNLERGTWGLELLALEPTDRVLEIGFGPGVTIQSMCDIVTAGEIWGLDHSEVMLNQARKRNRAAVDAGRVKLLLGSATDLPSFGVTFDKVLDINSFQFWDDKVGALKNLKKIMRPGGVIALVQQPRNPGATENDATEAGEKFASLLREADFRNVRIERKALQPVSAVCALGYA